MNRPDKSWNKLSVAEKEVGGIPNSSEDIKQAHAAAIEMYIQGHVGLKADNAYGNMYFNRTLNEKATKSVLHHVLVGTGKHYDNHDIEDLHMIKNSRARHSMLNVKIPEKAKGKEGGKEMVFVFQPEQSVFALTCHACKSSYRSMRSLGLSSLVPSASSQPSTGTSAAAPSARPRRHDGSGFARPPTRTSGLLCGENQIATIHRQRGRKQRRR